MNHKHLEISRAVNVFALLAYGSHAPPFARLIFSAFEDGTIIWARDRTFGGSPYFTANIGRDLLRRILDRLKIDGLFSDLPIVGGVVLSSECSCFVIKRCGIGFEFGSCHEQFEEPGKRVAEHNLIAPLGDRQRFDVLLNQPQRYIFSRMIWLELRRLFESMIPVTGQPCDGHLEMFQTEFRWIPEVLDDAEP